MKFILLLSLCLAATYAVNLHSLRQGLQSIAKFKQGGLCPNETTGLSPSPNAGKPPGPQPLTSCQWYKDSTCCSPDDASTITTSLMLLVNPDNNKKCYDQMSLLLCAVCSPRVAETGVEQGTLCTSFCGKLYDACKDVTNPILTGPILGGISGEENVTTIPSKDEFCSAPLAADSADCFNGASAFNFIAFAFVAVACLLF